MPQYNWLMLDPSLESLRADPAFAPIIDQSRTRFAQILTLLERAKMRQECRSYMEQPPSDLRAQLGIYPTQKSSRSPNWPPAFPGARPGQAPTKESPRFEWALDGRAG